MPGITLSQAETQLAAWLAADTAVASNQAYNIAGRSFTRADAKEIRANIEFWDNKVKQLSSAANYGGKVGRGITPVI